MKIVLKVLISLFFVSYSFATLLNSTSPTDKMVEEYIKFSGLSEQIKKIPKTVKSSMLSSYHEVFDGQDIEDLSNEIKNSFDITRMINTIKQGCKSELTKSELNNLLFWYKTDLARNIIDSEIKSTGFKNYQDALRKKDQLFKDKELVRLSKQINHLVKNKELNLKIIEQQQLALYCLNGCTKSTNEAIRLQIYSKNNIKRIEELNTLVSVYAYRDIDKKDLQKYIDFLKTPLAQKSVNVANKYIILAFYDASISVADKLINFIKNSN